MSNSKKGLHIPANQQRMKVEKINKSIEKDKTKDIPAKITSEMIYGQNKQLLEQQAYMIELLQKQ